MEEWLNKIRNILKSDDSTAIDFLNEIKLNLDLKEVFVFTPKGEMRTLPAGSTVLDFAYDLHTNLGNKCLGGKVNAEIVPRNYVLKNGDQLEIITSKNQYPTVEWFDYVKTTRAKECIKEAIRLEQKKYKEEGERVLAEIFKELGFEANDANKGKVRAATKIRSEGEFFKYIASGKMTKERVKQIISDTKNKNLESFQRNISDELSKKTLDKLLDEELEKNPEIFMLDESTSEKIKHIIAPCCKPIPGDQVVGFQVSSDEIIVHRTNCPEAIEQMSKFGNRIIKAKWRKEQEIAFLSGIRMEGFDKKGMIKDIIDIITSQHNLNIRSLNIATKNGVFTGEVMLYIENVMALNELIDQLHKIDNIEKIERIGFDIV